MPQDTDRFILLPHLIHRLQSALAEAKAQSAHPPELTRVGIPLEDIMNLRVVVGRSPAANSNLFEQSSPEQARAEVEANEAISRAVAGERDSLVSGELTAESFTRAIFGHVDPMRAARHILSPRLFFDARDRNIGAVPAEEIQGHVNLDASRCFRLMLSPANFSREKREVVSFLLSAEGTCPLFSARDQLGRRILLTEFADDTFTVAAMCAALGVNFSANVFLRLRATATEIRYSGEVEEIFDRQALHAEIVQASSGVLRQLPGVE